MVFIERDEELRKVKRHHCCKLKPEDEKTIENVIRHRKKHIAKELVRDVRGTRKHEAEKLLKVTDKLKVKRRDAEAKRTSLVNQWNKLKKSEEEFHCIFIEFHQFTIDNRERIGRERAKIYHLRQNIAKKDTEIREMNGKIFYFQNIFSQMKQNVDRHAFYEEFLANYAIHTNAKSIQDVLLRYALLLESREYMEGTMKRRNSSIMQYSKVYNKILQNWRGELLKFGEMLTQQSKKFEDAQRQVIYWERIIYDIQRHVHSLWMDIEMAQSSLDHVICLLLIRMKAKVAPGFFEKEKKFHHLLNTTEGKIIYLNKIMGDLTRVKNEVQEIFGKEQRAAKIDVATSMKPRPKHRAKRGIRKTPVTDGYPILTPGTARILNMLENKMRRAAEYSRRRTVKGEVKSELSYDTSTSDSTRSWDTRDSVMTSWLITKEARRKGKESLATTDHTTRTRGALLSTAPSRYSVPWTRMSGFRPTGYSCVNLTTDGSTTLIDERRTEVQDRIIERNFDRYEKFVLNKMDTESSVMKINKQTGKLVLPKLKFKRKHLIEKTSTGITLPKIDPNSQRKYRKRGLEDASTKTIYSQNTSVKSGTVTKNENLLFEDIRKFHNRPTRTQPYTFGNLL